ncbi:histidine phosphatase family protein [bacterium]|nr:histidine phosphatase family protein [bacterium]
MLIVSWTPLPPVRPLLAQIQRPQQSQALELAPVPSGFASVDEVDGSLAYQGPSLLCRRLMNSGVQVMAVRHGQSLSNAQSESLGQPLLYGQSESPLTDKGRAQAHTCAEQLYQQLGGEPWLSQALEDPTLLPVIVGSDLSRAYETATILKAGLARQAEELAGPDGRALVEKELVVLSDARLRETHFGRFETRPLAELQGSYPDFVSHWRPSEGPGTDFRHRFPGGESRADVMRRMGNFLDACCLRYPQKTVIMVSHGETLLSTRALLGKATETEGKVAAETGVIPNATPFWLVHNTGGGQGLPAVARRPYDLE